MRNAGSSQKLCEHNPFLHQFLEFMRVYILSVSARFFHLRGNDLSCILLAHRVEVFFAVSETPLLFFRSNFRVLMFNQRKTYCTILSNACLLLFRCAHGDSDAVFIPYKILIPKTEFDIVCEHHCIYAIFSIDNFAENFLYI